MVTPIPSPAVAEVYYPESDGQPMAETDVHRDLMLDLIAMLREYFRDDPHVYISGNLFLYYQEGDPRRVVAPDVFVVKGIPGHQRRIYKLWEEGSPPGCRLRADLTQHPWRRPPHQARSLRAAGGRPSISCSIRSTSICGRPSRVIGWSRTATCRCGRLPTGPCGVRCWGWSCTRAASACGYSTRRANGGCRSRRKSRRHAAQRRREPRSLRHEPRSPRHEPPPQKHVWRPRWRRDERLKRSWPGCGHSLTSAAGPSACSGQS